MQRPAVATVSTRPDHGRSWGVPSYPETQLVRDLPGAGQRGELLAHFQPQLDLATGRVTTVEALARWHHPEFGSIPPIEFIAVAETHGLVTELGDHILTLGLRQIARWRSAGLTLDLAVNMSPNQLVEGLWASVDAELQRWGLEPIVLTLELTETEPIADVSSVIACLTELRELGCGVSIDDFGAGYTTLDQLRSLPATELKLDPSIMRGPRDIALERLAPVMREARRFDLLVVAEGIETQEHLELATELGCDRAQGYLIGAPMDADKLERTLT